MSTFCPFRVNYLGGKKELGMMSSVVRKQADLIWLLFKHWGCFYTFVVQHVQMMVVSGNQCCAAAGWNTSSFPVASTEAGEP